ncbi:MAG: hypothetical protein AAFY55_02330 [Bacteroidota bacterium]
MASLESSSSAQPAPIPVIYTIANGRSGSTLLGQLLGNHPSIFNAGEVYNYRPFFLRGAEDPTRLCACGEPLRDCPFWKAIRARLTDGGFDPYIDLKDRDRFEAHNYALFSALLAESSTGVVMDSSKRDYRLRLLAASERFQVTIVHLTRDPRAYGYSVLNSPKRGEVPSSRYYSKLTRWTAKNLGVHLRYRQHPRYVQVRYEDLAENPEEQRCRILAKAGLTTEKASDDVTASIYHDFSGNQRTRDRPHKKVRKDTRYLEHLTPLQWRVGSWLTAPARPLFGYENSRPTV